LSVYGVRSIRILGEGGDTAVDFGLGDRPVLLRLCPVVGPVLVRGGREDSGGVSCADEVPVTLAFSDEFQMTRLENTLYCAGNGVDTGA
jgi:hypothetical protein